MSKMTETEPEDTSDDTTAVVGKGRATPSRKEQEAARKRPLVPNDRKEAGKQSKAAQQEARERARIGLANGDERYLTVRDRGPQRKFVRDFVDARWSVGEFLIPVMVLIIVATLVPVYEIQAYSIFALWGYFLLAVLDCILLAGRIQRKVGAKFGKDRVERGLRWYSTTRALQLRVLRLPKPQVKRGEYPA